MSLFTMHHGLKSHARILISFQSKIVLCFPCHTNSSKQPINSKHPVKHQNYHNLRISSDITMSEFKSPPLGAFILSPPLSKQDEDLKLKSEKDSFTGKSVHKRTKVLTEGQPQSYIEDNIEITNFKTSVTNTFMKEDPVEVQSSTVTQTVDILKPESVADSLLKEEVHSESHKFDIRDTNLMMKLRITGPPKTKGSILPAHLLQSVTDTVRQQYGDTSETKTDSQHSLHSVMDTARQQYSDASETKVDSEQINLSSSAVLDLKESLHETGEFECCESSVIDTSNVYSTVISPERENENNPEKKLAQLYDKCSESEIVLDTDSYSVCVDCGDSRMDKNNGGTGVDCSEISSHHFDDGIETCKFSYGMNMNTECFDEWHLFPFADVDLSENEKGEDFIVKDHSMRRSRKRKRKRRRWKRRKLRRTESEQTIACENTDNQDVKMSVESENTEDFPTFEQNENVATIQAAVEVDCEQKKEPSSDALFTCDTTGISADEDSCLPFAEMNVSGIIVEENDSKDRQSVERPSKRKGKKKSKTSKWSKKDSSTTENEKDENNKASDKKKAPAKRRPNYFIAVQITNPQVHSAVEEVQKTVLSKNEDLQSAMVSVPTIHLTLMVMYLGNQEDIDRARTALDKCAERLKDAYDKKLIVMDITGIGNFRDETVFAKVSPGEPLDDLTYIAEEVENCFEENGVPSTDKRSFKPHVTMMKMSKTHGKLKKKGVKKIYSNLYREHVDRRFGKQLFSGLQLCSMLKRKDSSGYYYVEHQVKIGPQKSNFSTLTSVQGHSIEEASALVVNACIQCAVEKVYKEMPKPKPQINTKTPQKNKQKAESSTKRIAPKSKEIDSIPKITKKESGDTHRVNKDLEPLIEISRKIVHSCIENAIKSLQNKVEDNT